MSATNRSALRVRVPHDEYRTPRSAIDIALRQVNWGMIHTVLEPCAGDGRIARDIQHFDTTVSVTAFDIQDGTDYLTRPAPTDKYHLGITNPPFSIAAAIVSKMLAECEGVLILQRLNWLGSAIRADWWRDNEPDYVFLLTKRPSFVNICKPRTYQGRVVNPSCGASYHPESSPTKCVVCGNPVGSGTDATEYAWFGWGNIFFNSDPGIHHP